LGVKTRVPEDTVVAVRLKLGVCMARDTFVDAVSVPEVPVIVIGPVPTIAVLVEETVRVDTLIAGFGENEAVAPSGSCNVTTRFTGPEKPPASVTLIFVEAEPPGFSEIVPCVAASQKPGICGPARSSIRLCPAGLPQPVVRS
jgi:hypothetical protein